jgi:hypothetical protein
LLGSAFDSQADAVQAASYYKKSYEIWAAMKEKGMLPSYYAHKPAEAERLMMHVTNSK